MASRPDQFPQPRTPFGFDWVMSIVGIVADRAVPARTSSDVLSLSVFLIPIWLWSMSYV